MRKIGTVLTAWLVCAWATEAQVQPQPGGKLVLPQPVVGGNPQAQLPPLRALDPTNPLDKVLMGWEAEMMKVQTLAAQLERTESDLLFKSNKVLVGYAQYMKVPPRAQGDKPLNKAMLEMRPKGKETGPNAELAEKFICTGTELYQYSVAGKVIQAHKLPEPPPGQVANDNFLSFLFGMRAQEAKRRYDLKLDKEDKFYYYINVQPLMPDDKAEFERAQVVLHRDTFLPAMLWFQQSKDSTVTWRIPAIKGGVQVDPVMFEAPKPPPGWKMVVAPQAPGGTVIRTKP